MRSLQTFRSTHDQRSGASSACLAVRGTAADCSSVCLSFTRSTFLRPFAPRALPRFPATLDALHSVTARLLGLAAGTPFPARNRLPCLTPSNLPAVRSPTTPRCPRLSDLLASPELTARVTSHPFWGPERLGLRLSLAGSPQRQAESSSSAYRPAVRLGLLPTRPRDRAVTSDYRGQVLPRVRTFTPPIRCARRRTRDGALRRPRRPAKSSELFRQGFFESCSPAILVGVCSFLWSGLPFFSRAWR